MLYTSVSWVGVRKDPTSFGINAMRAFAISTKETRQYAFSTTAFLIAIVLTPRNEAAAYIC